MLKYVSKFAMDILPSVAATIIGAYIVNHYIAAKPAADAPATAVSASAPKAADAKNKSAAKAPETSADVAKIPEAGVKAKGISEKGLLEKTAAEKPVMPEKPAEKVADKPAETASIPVETRRHQPSPREKAVAKVSPAPALAAPAVAAPTAVPSIEAAVPEERRDANELARAAIERLRGTGDGSPRVPEAARTPDAPHVASTSVPAPPLMTSPVRPLPPPVVVSAPGSEAFDSSPGSPQIRPPYLGAAGETSDLHRPTPPAEIPPGPVSRPLDLRAEATVPTPREHTSVAEDMLSAAKSVFHAVLPK
jgi:hypothetical protein